MKRQYYAYIMTNQRNTVLYTGITKLVYYEVFEDVENAILREKQIKGGSKQKKVGSINSMNREWRDLCEEL